MIFLCFLTQYSTEMKINWYFLSSKVFPLQNIKVETILAYMWPIFLGQSEVGIYKRKQESKKTRKKKKKRTQPRKRWKKARKKTRTRPRKWSFSCFHDRFLGRVLFSYLFSFFRGRFLGRVLFFIFSFFYFLVFFHKFPPLFI